MTPPRRVLVVNHSPNVWGAERQLLDLRPHLLGAGIAITLACAAGSDLERAWRQTGSETVPYEPAGPMGLREADGSRSGIAQVARQVGVTAVDARRIVKLIREVGADVVESYSLNANVEVVLAGRMSHTPTVFDVHDIVVAGIGRRILDLSAASATATIANSRATASTMGRGRVHIVYPGVDVERFRPGPADPAVRARLAAPARPTHRRHPRPDRSRKGDRSRGARHRPAAGGARRRAARRGRCDVDGRAVVRRRRSGPTSARLLGDRVRFVGPTDDVPAVMRRLDVLVNASRAEPFGLTVLEAQACGVAVVASAAGGIPEFVHDGINGLLFSPGDETSLTQASGARAR